MTIDDLKDYVRMMLNGAFPAVTVQFERINDDPFHLAVSVYGVETSAVKWVKEKILDIDEKLCADGDFALTPLVRDEATTDKFYPQFSTPWKWLPAAATVAMVVKPHAAVDIECLQSILNEMPTKWEVPEPLCSSAANEELALAA
jgi:hypothetical protein